MISCRNKSITIKGRKYFRVLRIHKGTPWNSACYWLQTTHEVDQPSISENILTFLLFFLFTFHSPSPVLKFTLIQMHIIELPANCLELPIENKLPKVSNDSEPIPMTVRVEISGVGLLINMD